MMSIAEDMVSKHSLKGIALIHRLGIVPVGEESILIALSSPHRQAAWRAGEEALEECKAKVEVWKREEFEDEEGVWRANRDGIMGQKISESEEKPQDGLD
jgi:molybdopterin synthase catalytic subunit